MNERIYKLAEQAWDATAVSPDFGHPVSFVEKFAELILQGCIAQVRKDENGPAYEAAARIWEHFGDEQ